MYNKILSNGFNRSFNETSMYGKGVYFARDASYCLDGNYSQVEYENDYKEYQYLLYSRVIIGDICNGSSNMTVSPYKNNAYVHYETMVDNVKDPTIFSVTTDGQALPVVLIQLEIGPLYNLMNID